MSWLFIALVLFVLCFSFVILFGAPYVPTRKEQIEQALKLLQLNAGDHLYELGAGSGGITLAAAKSGVRVTAFEINPLLVLLLKFRTRKYRNLVSIRFGSFWRARLSSADGVYVFLLDRYMRRLDEKLAIEAPGCRLVSYTFQIPGKKPDTILGPMFLYKY